MMALFLLVFLSLVRLDCVFGNMRHLDTEVELHCMQRCPLQNRTDNGHFDIECGRECNLNKCTTGCKLWKKAIQSSCKSVCNGTTERLPQKELYCVMGCNDALATYFTQLRAHLGTPPAPALVADSLTATSLRLEWNFPEVKQIGLSYLVQWRFEQSSAAWQYCRNQTWESPDTVFVHNLSPYTKYRFRIALILAHHGELIGSAPSVVISTLPSGVPSSPPSIVRAVAIDASRVSVSWEPGQFPHGPLLSYVLRISDNHPNGYSALKDISPDHNFYMFQNLMPSQNYTVSISMRNEVGLGPTAEAYVSTPVEKLVKDTEQPVLILAANHDVIKQDKDLLDEPVKLYSTKYFIKGIAIHVYKQLLFISDSRGDIHRLSLDDNADVKTLLSASQLNFLPLDLSVDWLNDHLYVIGEIPKHQNMWQITRCNLEGSEQTVAIAGLKSKPLQIEVDPYNGYLFWTANDVSKVGLYRLDLSDISNGVKHDVKPSLVLQEANLGAFAVDYGNFHLLIANQDQNTVNSVSFDGTEVVNLRPNINKSRLQNVVSLATANKRFFWTDGMDVFYEEYHKAYNSFFHNVYPHLTPYSKAQSYLKVLVNLPVAQPIPLPVNPPTAVQVIFGINLAQISWRPPHLLGFQGKGAWQNWSYQIEVKQLNKNSAVVYKDVNTTSYTISNLEPHRVYVIKAAAYTVGRGPWSKEFSGTSLRVPEEGKLPFILWSAAEGLLKSDTIGENVETIIHGSMMANFHFINVAWFRSQLYLVTNTSEVFWYNTVSHDYGQLKNIENVESIAIDWIGQKLYWSNPKQQLIIRGNLDGTQQEPLPILTLAKELTIDATQAYLYWSTGYAVECAHLNGASYLTYHPAQLFSGKQVTGLTLDMEHHLVYWIVRSTEGSDVFRAPMAGYLPDDEFKPLQPEMFSRLQKPNIQGPLCYFDNRLLWLQDFKNAAISDTEVKNIAMISGKSMSHLTMVYVVDYSLHVIPKGENLTTSLSVIPEPIESESVNVKGSWTMFNITWNPVRNVNYGTVFYEINVNSIYWNDSSIITTKPSVTYWRELKPYTELHVSLRAFTYWGSSPHIQTKVFSPASTPSEPCNLRTYVTFGTKNDIAVTFRWSEPVHSNGVLRGYRIACWYHENEERVRVCEDVVVDSGLKEFVLQDARANETYYFQAQAYTEVGNGQLSDVVVADTSFEIPIPRLLITSNDSVFVHDIDSNESRTLLHGLSAPVEMSYIIKEDKLFWINDMSELLMFVNYSNKYNKIRDLKGEAISLTVDWLERSLYFALTRNDSLGSAVYKLDLNQMENGLMSIKEILFTSSTIARIEVSPFTRKLYWTESDPYGGHSLKHCDFDGTNTESLLYKNGFSCNCSLFSSVGAVFALDHSRSDIKPLVIFIDEDTHDVVTTDTEGCTCKVAAKNSGPHIRRLKSDFNTLYWTNRQQKLVMSTTEGATEVKAIYANDFMIFGPHVQPYPPDECLTPKGHDLTMALVENSATSLMLELPESFLERECNNNSFPTTQYIISYSEFHDHDERCTDDCRKLTTFERTVQIEELQPYTKYMFTLAVRNYYLDANNRDSIVGNTVIFQTGPGIPSAPETVSAEVLNPTLVEVRWSRPKTLNGPSVRYEIHWQTVGTDSGIRQKGEQTIVEGSGDVFRSRLQKLTPNETYALWVRVYSDTNASFTDSESVRVVTFPEPSDVFLEARTAYSVKVRWRRAPFVQNYTVQYTSVTTVEWVSTNETFTYGNDDVYVNVDGLKPKTQYKFRVVLQYPKCEEFYVWPSDSRFVFETEGDKPSPPGIPIIQHVRGDVYQVWWEPSKDNGVPIELYTLQVLKLPNYRTKRNTNRSAWLHNSPEVEEPEMEWESIYNGSDTSWIITGLSEEFKYAFRALAYNAYGWSEPSEESVEFDIAAALKLAEKTDPTNLILVAVFVPVVIFFSLIICFICCKRQCPKDKKTKKVLQYPIVRGPDVELATLRELPRRSNFVHNTNVLYTTDLPPSDNIVQLPLIRRDQITLMKLLGSGAFGEVFEGKAHGIQNGETKVAVKTLRKGATEQEKSDFLQEAELMSQFKHKHILQLLGVCLDNDPQFIIMELMEGGDLLTYLRSSRKLSSNNCALSLLDLLKMCVDVANGCCYLEETHFVHRDLACRNCLVSSSNPSERLVKIGDFGLARDIYKNDYYRKEGEGLLPVRWMAPESLVYGVFTSQSDVWSFGVLLWEIMTLGQQPYPAVSNLEILCYLKEGKRLGRPTDCPEELHCLMLKCWDAEPEDRPTFKYCLQVLEGLNARAMSNPVATAHEGHYVSTVPDELEAVSNGVYFGGENHYAGMSGADTQPFLAHEVRSESPANTPKYLELLYDEESLAENDGYEIPTCTVLNSEQQGQNSKSNGVVCSLAAV